MSDSSVLHFQDQMYIIQYNEANEVWILVI